MRNLPTDTDALRALLERLFPDIQISSTGVALLAAQIAELENRCELMPNRIDHQFTGETGAGIVGTRVLLPITFDCEDKFGTTSKNRSHK